MESNSSLWHVAFFAYLICWAFVFANKLRQKNLIEILPSFAWLCLMALPFWLQMHSFVEIGKNEQAMSILMIGLSLCLGDHFAYRFFRPHSTPESEDKMVLISILALVFSVAIWLFHLYSMPEIPYLQEWLGERDGHKLSQLRENSSKLLDVPRWFIYLCQITSIAAPVFIIALATFRKFGWVILFAICTYIYSRSTLAKGPYLVFLLLMVILSLQMAPLRIKKYLVAGFALVTAIVASWSVYQFTTNHDLSPFLYEHKDQVVLQRLKDFEATQSLTFTYADNFRLASNRPEYLKSPGYVHMPFYFLYRMFLVPVEVSHYWYVYFPEKYGKYIGFDGLTPGSRDSETYVHPANAVGVWAFRQRFPAHYLESVRAYASVDADAHGRWGVWGVFVVAIFLLGLRFILSALRDGSMMMDLFYYTALCILSITLPAASIQAILVAHGLLALVLIMAGLRSRFWPIFTLNR